MQTRIATKPDGSRRSFLGVLFGMASAAVGAVLALPVFRYMFYPLTARTEDLVWTDAGPSADVTRGRTPVRLTLELKQRDPAVAAQLGRQAKEEQDFFEAPFQPYTVARVGGSPAVVLDAAATRGQEIFNSSGCGGCHGVGGAGGFGPALINTYGLYTPVQLVAILRRPTAMMRAGGMVPLTLSDADMKALLAYMGSLAGRPDALVIRATDPGLDSRGVGE